MKQFHYIPLHSILIYLCKNKIYATFKILKEYITMTTIQENIHIKYLKEDILKKFGKTLDSPTDYDNLFIDIQNKTGETVSSTTLKRIYGYIKPTTIPRPSTLSILARYVGYSGWSDFCQNRITDNIEIQQINHSDHQSKHVIFNIKTIATFTAFITIITILILASKKNTYIYKENKSDIITDSIFLSETNHSNCITKDPLQIKYDSILNICITEAIIKCNNIQKEYKRMNIVEYWEYVNNEYIKIVFTDLKTLVSSETAKAFSNKSEREKYNYEIFSKCRDYCANKLLRDFPTEELNKNLQSDK